MPEEASAVFARARAVVAEGGSEEVPQAQSHPPRQTNIACPDCLSAGAEVPLVQNPGAIALTCRNGHRRDMEWVAENQQSLRRIAGVREQTTKAPQLQPDAIPVTLRINKHIVEKLQAKFGSRLPQSITAILERMIEDKAFIVSMMDADRLSQHLEKPIPDAGTLVGSIVALRMQRDDAIAAQKFAEEKLKTGASPAATANQLCVTLSEGALAKLKEKAEFNGTTAEKHLSTTIGFAIDQGWC